MNVSLVFLPSRFEDALEPYDGHVFGGSNFEAIYHRLHRPAVEGRSSRGHFARALVQQGAQQVLPQSVVENT